MGRPLTITEKIILNHVDNEAVSPGDIVNARVDIALGNDITAPIAIKEFESIGIDKVFDREKIALVPDHFVPNKDILSAKQAKILREFAKKHDIKYYFECGEAGIEHALLPEKGIVLPGDLVIGADSHTCTYGALGGFATGVGSTDLAYTLAFGELWLKVPESIKVVFEGKPKKWVSGKDLVLYLIGKIGVEGANYMALEFSGSTFKHLGMSDRFTISNMAIEAGAKSGIFEPDEITEAYVKDRAGRNYTFYKSDDGAEYSRVLNFDSGEINPQVAFPHLPENSIDIGEASAKNIKIDQSVIGSCTNGRIEDLRIAAQILKGKKIAKYTRLIVLPATPAIYKMAEKEGLIDIFMDAGAVFSTPTCGPCLGGYMGILADGERAISSTNRNFKGRMGDVTSEVYLANPAVCAASAILGKIAGPDDVI
ncbi:3-isopropylmalate dehydratase large subunit [Candidatus Acidulodesulfobacterium sp. H_13]|uniref:3-isopropylmalate dehydratase large subunit n=1 Tax=Candidatus Acidulodesulfobacterium sp. H_13 TaxID=3395470 RepID=UPI003AF73C7A